VFVVCDPFLYNVLVWNCLHLGHLNLSAHYGESIGNKTGKNHWRVNKHSTNPSCVSIGGRNTILSLHYGMLALGFQGI
jgi:hypothetical protein